MLFKTLKLSILFLCCALIPVQASSKSPAKATKNLKILLDATTNRDHVAFLKPGTQTFKNAISKAMFDSVCDQVSENLSKGYTFTYFGYLNHSSIIEHVYKIQCKGVDDDFLARITILNGKVAGFLLQ